jgi:hypothetical protein
MHPVGFRSTHGCDPLPVGTACDEGQRSFPYDPAFVTFLDACSRAPAGLAGEARKLGIAAGDSGARVTGALPPADDGLPAS